jgi:hypothetical protein
MVICYSLSLSPCALTFRYPNNSTLPSSFMHSHRGATQLSEGSPWAVAT